MLLFVVCRGCGSGCCCVSVCVCGYVCLYVFLYIVAWCGFGVVVLSYG